MKFFFVYILALLYFSSSTGADVYFQHCLNGLLEHGSKNHNLKTCLQQIKDKKGESVKYCCEQENRNSNYKTDHIAAVSVHHVHHPVSVTLLSTNFIIQSAGHSFLSKESPVNSPLLQISGVAVYIRNCVFLI